MNPSDIPCLVYNYLRECGYLHSAAALSCEAMIKLADPTLDMVDPGLLRVLIGKGIAYAQLETLCLDSNVSTIDSSAMQTTPIATTSENKQTCVEGIRLMRYPLKYYLRYILADDNYPLRILRFGPSKEPALSARLVVISCHSLHLIDAETRDELASRALDVTEDLAMQAFVCPDGLTFGLVAKLPAAKMENNNDRSSNSNDSLAHFLVINTVSLHILYRYSLSHSTKSISMGSKWITCICDKQDNAVMIPRPVSNRSKSQINLTVHPLPEAIVERYHSRLYGDISRSATSRERGWALCAFQSAGTCSGLSSYFYILQNEVLALYSPLGILHLYVPFADNEDAGTLTPRYINLPEFLKLSTPAPPTVYSISFIESLPYVACVTSHGLAMINYRYLLYGALCTQVEKQYSSWAYCEKLDPSIITIDTGIWKEQCAVMVCSDNRIIILSIETGHPLFILSITDLQNLHGRLADWPKTGSAITDLAFVCTNGLAVVVCNDTSSDIWCMKVFLDCATDVLESTLIYKGVSSRNRFIGRDRSNGIRRLYLSGSNCDVIELAFHRPPHR